MRIVDPSKVYRLFYPAVPAVIAASHEGVTSAMPVVSSISLSNDPPLLGASFSPIHATFRRVLESKSFSISWLDRRYAHAVEFLGTNSGNDVTDKLRASGLHYRIGGPPLSVPLIDEASAFLVCRLEETREYGDHVLVVGRVVEAMAEKDFGEYWAFESYDPILYAGLSRGKTGTSLSLKRP